jgi:hypothetical protein
MGTKKTARNVTLREVFHPPGAKGGAKEEDRLFLFHIFLQNCKNFPEDKRLSM